MKTIVMVVATVFFMVFAQEDVKKVNATFKGYEEGSYYFETEDETTLEFQIIEETALNKFDLSDKKFVGKKFDVTYSETTDYDEDDEEYTLLTIVDLQLK